MKAEIQGHPDFIPKIEYVDISLLEPNEGQYSKIDEETNRQVGLGSNPRWIRDTRYEALKKSITDDPEYMLYHPLEIFTLSHIKGKDGKYIIVGGNQRYQACKELGWEQIPCIVFLPDTPFEKLRAYAIKSNEAYGQNDYDILSGNEWNQDELQDWGMELDFFSGDYEDNNDDEEPKGEGDGDENGGKDETQYTRKIQPPVYEITGAEPAPNECVEFTPVKRLLEEIETSSASEEVKEMLRICAYRHAVIHFDLMAEFYAHQNAEIQELMENNALVIIDYNKAIERNFVEMTSRLQSIIPENNGSNNFVENAERPEIDEVDSNDE